MLEGAPATVTIDVETVNGSNLVVEEVGLRVDGVDVEGMNCDGPGACSFEIELEEGEYELRAWASRNLGPELVSNVVTVTVVAGAATSTGADASGSSSTSGSGSSGQGSEDGSGGDPPVGDDGGDDKGCGCTHGTAAWPALLVVLAAGRRRRSGRAFLL
jgi:uncharacterized protein (TIGR03382 family)